MVVSEFLLNTSYWAWFGTIYLIMLTYQDIKNKMNIDDRKNWFMMGMSLSLYSHVPHNLWFIFGLIFIVIGLGYFLKKTKAVGEGDINTIRWIFLGFGILSLIYLMWFTAIFFTITILYMLIKIYILKIKENTPFYPVILFSFILTTALFGIYL